MCSGEEHADDWHAYGTHFGAVECRWRASPGQRCDYCGSVEIRGYATGGFGKWGIGDIGTDGAAEKQGFDTFLGYYHQIHAHSYYPEYLIRNGTKVPLPGNSAYNQAKPAERPKGFMPSEFPKGHRLEYSHYAIVEGMMEFIRANKDRPFFCYAPWTPPHGAYDIPADDPAVAAVSVKPWPLKAKVIAAMDAMIDRQVGEVLGTLRELGIDERTVVFFCSDNGAAERMEGSLDSSGPFRGRKRDMTEGGLRTPFLVRWPGKISPGAVSALPCYFPDVMPTLADLAGATSHVPIGIDGISLVPTLLGKPMQQRHRSFLYWEWTVYDWKRRDFSTNGPMQAVRRGRWKGIRLRQNDPVRIYDLRTDAREEIDLAEAHPLVAAELAALMDLSRTPERPQPEPEMPEGRRYR